MPVPDDQTPTPEELAARQARREQAERERAQAAVDDREAHTHDRRAEEAGYLREKLEEQAGADREAGGRD